MDLNTITVADFKAQFPRAFPYLPTWDNTATYNTNDEVYYETNGLFYRCLNDSVTSIPTDTNDWLQYVDSVNNYVLDADIERAFEEAKIVFNQSLFSSDAQITLAYLYVTAHYLVIDLRNAISGLNSKGSNIVSSRSVGSVSESYAIPERFQNDPILNLYTQTGFGNKYLSLVMPKLIGNVFAVDGAIIP